MQHRFSILVGSLLALPLLALGQEPSPTEKQALKEEPFAAALAVPLLLFQAEQPTPESLILETLEQLTRTQKKNGRWKAPRKTPEKMTDAGVTGLAVLTLIGDGHTHKFGKYRKNVAKAVDYLEKQVDEKGRVKGSFSNQALVTHALAEIYSVSRDEDLKEMAEKAVEGLVGQQNEDGSFGGLRSGAIYQTTLGLLALKSAKIGGLQVKGRGMKGPAEALTALIDRASLRPKGDPSPLGLRGSLAAVFLGRIFSGVRKSESLQVDLARRFEAGEYPSTKPREAYLVISALFQLGGDAWKHFLKGQDGWMDRRKRSKDLAGKLFEVLALQVRFRWERAQR